MTRIELIRQAVLKQLVRDEYQLAAMYDPETGRLKEA